MLAASEIAIECLYISLCVLFLILSYDEVPSLQKHDSQKVFIYRQFIKEFFLLI